ncbi:MAG: formylglycine-generating enzyme family protein [Bacteroidota bacterium]
MTALFSITRNSTQDFPLSFLENTQSTGVRMLYLPGGTFEMGNNGGEENGLDLEAPRHPVSLPAFYLAEYPVTQGLWEAVYIRLTEEEKEQIPANPSHFTGPQHPVERASWHEASAFCKALVRLTGQAYRLPTEAEWEYAARCGKRGKLYGGSSHLEEVGWYDGNNAATTMPVGLMAPNEWGLYDLSGNVYEWCADHYADYHNAPRDGRAQVSSDPAALRVRRGGSWGHSAGRCRSASRDWPGPGNRNNYLGFRLALSQFGA